MALLASLEYPGMNGGQRYRILTLKRHISEMLGNYLESARLGDQVLRLAPATDAPPLKRQIWRDLQRTGTAQLEQAAAQCQKRDCMLQRKNKYRARSRARVHARARAESSTNTRKGVCA